MYKLGRNAMKFYGTCRMNTKKQLQSCRICTRRLIAMFSFLFPWVQTRKKLCEKRRTANQTKRRKICRDKSNFKKKRISWHNEDIKWKLLRSGPNQGAPNQVDLPASLYSVYGQGVSVLTQPTRNRRKQNWSLNSGLMSRATTLPARRLWDWSGSSSWTRSTKVSPQSANSVTTSSFSSLFSERVTLNILSRGCWFRDCFFQEFAFNHPVPVFWSQAARRSRSKGIHMVLNPAKKGLASVWLHPLQ